MAFDAGFTKAIINELSASVTNARVEKIFQPSKESVLFVLRGERNGADRGATMKLLIDAGSANPRMSLADPVFDNPKVPPMFCMLLRKHLGGARITSVRQIGFDRAAEFEFEARDELGYLTKKYIYAEIMGKFSNLIFCDAEKKIISAVRTNDITSGSKRPVIPGALYTPPPAQEGKRLPFGVTEESFVTEFRNSGLSGAKFIMNTFSGISPLVAREAALCAGEDGEKLWAGFSELVRRLEECDFVPVMLKKPDGTPLEYSFMPIKQYGDAAEMTVCGSFSGLIEEFFAARAHAERIRQRAADILRLLTNAETRLTKKIAAQQADLEACRDKERFRLSGDLITANIYRLSRGMTEAMLPDWSDGGREVRVELDSRLTPSQNAQRYYKRYAKCKSAEINLKKQTEIAREELDYIATVSESLTKAETENDLSEIRRELYESGYASKMKNYHAVKIPAPKPMEFVTSGGCRVLCGKNNAQNDWLTNRLAGKNDIWFHVKGLPGSHVVLLCGGEEPPASDFTEAANIAAVYSKAPRGQKTEVDYTRVKNIKKPPASKPGYVTFSSNYSAVVTPDPDAAERLRKRS